MVSSGFEGYLSSVSITGTGAMTSAGRITKKGNAAIAGSGTMTTSGRLIKKGASTIVGSASVSASGNKVTAIMMENGLMVTTNTPRTVPPNVYNISIEAWGAGGGGSTAGDSYDYGSGGGGGAYVFRNSKSVVPGSQIAFV